MQPSLKIKKNAILFLEKNAILFLKKNSILFLEKNAILFLKKNAILFLKKRLCKQVHQEPHNNSWRKQDQASMGKNGTKEVLLLFEGALANIARALQVLP